MRKDLGLSLSVISIIVIETFLIVLLYTQKRDKENDYILLQDKYKSAYKAFSTNVDDLTEVKQDYFDMQKQYAAKHLKLKSCKLCKTPAIVSLQFGDWVIKCLGHNCRVEIEKHDTPHEAIKSWNKLMR
jgi:hypothetical protein